MFDLGQGIALHAMQGNRSPSITEWEVSWFSRLAAGTWRTFSTFGRGRHEQLLFFQRRKDSTLVKIDTSGV